MSTFDPSKFGIKMNPPGTNNVPSNSASSFDPSKMGIKMNAPAPKTNVQVPQKTSLLGTLGSAAKGVGNFLTSAEQGLGKNITSAITAGSNTDQFTQTLAQHDSITKSLQDAIATKTQNGQDTTALKNALQSHINENPKQEDFTGKLPSTGEVLGNAAGTALDAVSFGTYGKAAKGMETGTLATKAVPSVVSGGEKLIGTVEKLGEAAKPTIEKGVDAVKKILPEAKTTAEKALSLGEKELSAVDKSKLKYLTDKGFDMTKTEGGILKEKIYKMTDQVKKLASEFKDVLTGKTPEENIQNVQKELGKLQQQSKTAFDGVNKTINKNTLVSGIKNAIGKMSDSIYEGYTKEQQAAFSDKRIADFLSHVKDGTLKGLDDALESFRSANAKSDATISKAADTTYQAVKKYIVDSLPADKAAIYKTANKSQAKLFDVAEILKGKIQASIGSLSKAGKFLKGAGTVAGGIAIEKGVKNLVPGIGQFLP